MSRGENFVRARVLEDEANRLVPSAPAVGRSADPVVVHVQAQRGRRRIAGEAPRFARVLVEGETEAAELLRQRQLQVAGGLELVKVFLAELVIAIVARRTRAASLEQRIRKNRAGHHSHRTLLLGRESYRKSRVSARPNEFQQTVRR